MLVCARTGKPPSPPHEHPGGIYWHSCPWRNMTSVHIIIFLVQEHDSNTLFSTGCLLITHYGYTLDVQAQQTVEGTIKTGAHRNATHNGWVLVFNSHHPVSAKVVVVRPLRSGEFTLCRVRFHWQRDKKSNSRVMRAQEWLVWASSISAWKRRRMWRKHSVQQGRLRYHTLLE